MAKMVEQLPQPISRHSNAGPGFQFSHRSAAITVTTDGIEVAIGGLSNQDKHCVGFTPPSGPCSCYNCFAVICGSDLLLFEGPGLGTFMLTREQVLAAVVRNV